MAPSAFELSEGRCLRSTFDHIEGCELYGFERRL